VTRGNARGSTNTGEQDDIKPIDLTSSPTQEPQQENAAPQPPAGTKRKSRANEGGDSKIFYAGYVFFEQKRTAEKKPKSKKRLEMENVWPNGVDRETFRRLRKVSFCFVSLCFLFRIHHHKFSDQRLQS
jgi:hypothetical protein